MPKEDRPKKNEPKASRDVREGFAVFVPGKPRGKGRPRFSKGGHVYTDKETVSYENWVAERVREFTKGELLYPRPTPVVVEVLVNLAKPKSKSQYVWWVVTRPDLDNIVKSILDGLNRSNVWEDDSQVTPPKRSSRCRTKIQRRGEHISASGGGRTARRTQGNAGGGTNLSGSSTGREGALTPATTTKKAALILTTEPGG
jgi:Holliday junction resolvase RusA-like endonuclease